MSTKTRPRKPRADFPMYPHRNGQWAKKIKGKTWFFGTWDSPDAALQSFVEQRDDIHAGRDPNRQRRRAVSTGLTVADVVNLHLESLNARLSREQISARHFSDCVRTGELIVKHFGRRIEAATLRAADFTEFRKSFPSTWGNTKAGLEIQRVRTCFNWAAKAEHIPGVPNFGPDFTKPGKSEARVARARKAAQNGSMDFTAAELRKLIEAANGWLKACILVGINAGFGNMDCAGLRAEHVDFQTGFYDLARQKTGVPRQFFLWQRTLDAIEAVMHERPIAGADSDESLCFLTTSGRPVLTELVHPTNGTVCRRDTVGRNFRKLVADCGVRSGRGFYCLRRTFETVAGNAKDQVAVDMVMGHTDESMAEVYRQGIDPQRLRDVAQHVERWLYPETVEG